MRRVGKFSPVYGGTWPAEVWHTFMESALAGTPAVDFWPPDQKLWPYGKYVSENGRGKTISGSGSRYTTPTTKKPFWGFPTTPTTAASPPPPSTIATTPPMPPGP
jgi:membrane peptidoglycan carboxypeptidase